MATKPEGRIATLRDLNSAQALAVWATMVTVVLLLARRLKS